MTTRILLIEDDVALLDLFGSTLEAEGYSVTACASVAKARDELRPGTPFDLAIMDFWVGDETSLEFSRELRRLQPKIPVIFMSGGGDDLSLETTSALAEADGAAEFLFKPFKMEALLNSVTVALASI